MNKAEAKAEAEAPPSLARISLCPPTVSDEALAKSEGRRGFKNHAIGGERSAPGFSGHSQN